MKSKKVIPIFLAFDNNYASCAAVTIVSIVENSKEYFSFYLLECCEEGISLNNKHHIESLKSKYSNFSIEWIYVNSAKQFNGFKTSSYISLATYGRILIPTLKPNLDKVIYLDVDLIATGDVSKLYNCELGGYVIGAVYDDYNEDNNINSKLINNLACSTSHKYFNAGVLLIDVQKWNKLNITQSIIQLEKEIRPNLVYADQDLLNKYFDCNYQLLDPSFNVSHKRVRKYYQKWQLTNCIIRHFVGHKKPWLIHPLKLECVKKDYIGKNLFWKYAMLTPFKFQLLSRFPLYSSIMKFFIRNNKV